MERFTSSSVDIAEKKHTETPRYSGQCETPRNLGTEREKEEKGREGTRGLVGQARRV